MEAPRRPRRHLLKPRPLGDAPGPARLQLATPGTAGPAVALEPDYYEPPYDPTSAPGAPEREEMYPPSIAGLSLVPSIAPRSTIEPIEASEADDDAASVTWMLGVQAREAERTPGGDGDKGRDDAVPMEAAPGDPLRTLGVRLQARRARFGPIEWIALAAMLALTPFVLGGGIVLGLAVARVIEGPSTAVTSPAPEPVVLEALPPVEVVVSDELVPAPVAIEDADSVPELRREAPAPAAPKSPWDGPPADVPSAAPETPADDETAERSSAREEAEEASLVA